ncbi:hypothetical protein CSKR_109764 [Clonorchis sinensis]|uniref:Uncharacterized protein n=1 Tax=Clonorchis sinensis TaxID=79923 RepID=A0A419QDP5_CLOSI|nr:hypothetical protein CSKR_109764 [Clonorchis sinensis]
MCHSPSALKSMFGLTIEQGSKTLICIWFTKLNIHLLLERVFLNFSGYSLTATQLQANATKQVHKFRNRSHFSRDAKRIYEKMCYSHTSSVVSTVTSIVNCPLLHPIPHTKETYKNSVSQPLYLTNETENSHAVFVVFHEQLGFKWNTRLMEIRGFTKLVSNIPSISC